MKKTQGKRSLSNAEITTLQDEQLAGVGGGVNFNINFANTNLIKDLFINGIPTDWLTAFQNGGYQLP